MAWASVGGAVIGGVGSMIGGNKASKDQKKAQGVALSNAGQAYEGIDVTSSGGQGVKFQQGMETVPGTRGRVQRNAITGVEIDTGDLEGTRQNLTSMLDNQSGNLGMDANTQALLQNFHQAGGQFGDAGLGQLGQLQQGGMNAYGMAQGQLGQAGQFSGQLQQQAMDMFGGLQGTADARSAQALGLMRDAARPGEERQMAGLQDQQFLRGQSGTTGGGLQTEAFARGLAGADTERQLAAMGEGRAAANQQLNQAMGLMGQSDGMMGNAMNRFGQMTQMNQGLGQDRFNRTSDLANRNFQRAGTMFQMSPQAMQQQMMQQQLGTMGMGMDQIGSINNNALNFANFSQNMMAQQANARGGQQNVLTNMMNSAGDAGQNQANMWGQIGDAFANNGGGVMDALGGMFGGGGGNRSPQQSVPTQNVLDWIG